MTSEELKPCPFCGASDVADQTECRGCGAKGPRSWSCLSWNTRAAIESLSITEGEVEQRARELLAAELRSEGMHQTASFIECDTGTSPFGQAALRAITRALSLPSTARDEGWEPIKTAPKDGRRVLVAVEGVDRPVLAEWNGAEWWTIDGHDWRGRKLTHWRPLPDPPAIRALKGKPTPVEGEE